MNKLYMLIIFAVTSCAIQPPPTAKELSTKYTENKKEFQALKLMIIEDSEEKECSVVGADNIDDYWESGGDWSHRNDHETKLATDEVLRRVGITAKRYNEYMSIFGKVGVERVTFCSNTTHSGDWVRVLAYRSGLSVSGCSGTIQWFEHSAKTGYGKRGEGDFLEVHIVGDGWQSMIDCT